MKTKNIWTDFAISYDQVLSNLSGYHEFVECALHHLEDAEHILDQGCGTGIFSVALAQKGKKIKGIDTNHEMMDVAKSKLLANPSLDIELTQADAQNLPFNNELFDGAVSNNVLFFVDHPKKLIREAARTLKTDGIFVITNPRPNYLSDPECMTKLGEYLVTDFESKGIYNQLKKSFEHFAECSRLLLADGIYNTYTSKQLSELLLVNGFSKIIAEYDNRYMGYSCQVVAQK